MAYCHFPSYCCWPLLPNKPFSRSQCLSFAKCFTSMILPNIFHKDVRRAMSIPAYRWENEVKKGVELSWRKSSCPGYAMPAHSRSPRQLLVPVLLHTPRTRPSLHHGHAFTPFLSHLLCLSFPSTPHMRQPSPLPNWLSFQPFCLGLSGMRAS